MPVTIEEQGHYEVLSLPATQPLRNQLNEQDIKFAYRRALLLHHPDKCTPPKTTPSTSTKPTIDQITLAYKTLISPTLRKDYDRTQALKASTTTLRPQTSHPGLETVDLDDLHRDDQQALWYRSCRCGKERAYTITEEELEMNAEEGEIVTGCQGCSLWLRVTFAVAEDG